MRATTLASGGRYPVLRTIAILFMVGAVIALIYGIYQAIVTLVGARSLEVVSVAASSWPQQIMGFFLWLAITFFAVISNLAIAEGIKLFIDIEYSCRNVAVNAFTTGAAAVSRPLVMGSGDGLGGRLCEEPAEMSLLKGD